MNRRTRLIEAANAERRARRLTALGAGALDIGEARRDAAAAYAALAANVGDEARAALLIEERLATLNA